MKQLFTGAWRGVLSTFLAGLFAILPLVITIGIVTWVINFILGLVGGDTLIGRGLRLLTGQWVNNETLATLLAWVVVLGVIFLLGLLVRGQTKSFLVTWFDNLFQRMPLIGGLYGTASQFVKLLNKQEKSELSGMSVVMVRFGERQGVGFLGLMPSRELYRFQDVEYHVVYIPTSPVPMTGGMLYVPASQVEKLPMSVESLMSVYLSMGITSPQAFADRLVSAAEKLAPATPPTEQLPAPEK